MAQIHWGESSMEGRGVMMVIFDDLSDIFNYKTLYNL